ncbi:alcohol dehydrogenase catalytic domain-containing protein [Rhodobacter ferrooxidans]|uniref:Alcohol dehydrogenase n=1 Tax=Rhodobacter ferrooxidans TaxID=371731 RepID=C8S1E5_9RHOB|nr:hypothetical protein [Rhodobacter sp. SW2]EEW25118.1 alcohol dehydrogenase [Rhodobacter sp. SW2]
MQAAILTQYGTSGNIRIVERPDPVPAAGEVLVRLHATSVNSGDARMRALDVPRGMALAMGWSAPRQPVLGGEGAGVVVGPAGSRWANR